MASVVLNRTNYLPCHGALNVNNLGQVRGAFDASVKFQNSSLSGNLLSGSELFNKVVSVLINFRKVRYAVMEYIKSTFHQVFVKPSDTDSLRFIWREKTKHTEFAKLNAFVSYMPLCLTCLMYLSALRTFALYPHWGPYLHVLLASRTLFT